MAIAYLCFDTEHVAQKIGDPYPFAIGFCLAVQDEDGFFRHVGEYDRQFSAPIVGEPATAPWEWWHSTKELEGIFDSLQCAPSGDPQEHSFVVAREIHAYIRKVVEAFPDHKIIPVSDTVDDFEYMDKWFCDAGLLPLRYATSKSGKDRGSVLNFGSWAKGYDFMRVKFGFEPISLSAPSGHAHDHIPLSDALNMMERFIWMLNS